MNSENRAPVFATTHWSVVLAAGGSSSPGSYAALERLCQAYWFPLYGFIRSKGFNPHDAEDLTQEFFARFLESGALRVVNAERGRFRAFLLASMNHFLANEWDRQRAQKRGGGKAPISLDAATAEERLGLEPAMDLAPDQLYDRRWALALLDAVLARLAAEQAMAGKGTSFEVLRVFLSDAKNVLSYSQAAMKLDVTEAAARKMVQRLRGRYRELLREEVAQTVASPHEVENELRHLLAVFAR